MDEIWIFFVVFTWETVIYFPMLFFFPHKIDHFSIMKITADR